MPFEDSRESQRDSAPKPRVARHELPWEKRVVAANPNGVVARGRRWVTTPLGLKIARTIGLSVVPCGTDLAPNIRKALGLGCGIPRPGCGLNSL